MVNTAPLFVNKFSNVQCLVILDAILATTVVLDDPFERYIGAHFYDSPHGNNIFLVLKHFIYMYSNQP